MDAVLERTLIISKPDAVKRGLESQILSRFLNVGLRLVAIKVCHPDLGRLKLHYAKDEFWLLKKGNKKIAGLGVSGQPVKKSALEYGQEIVENVLRYMSSGVIIVMVFEGYNALVLAKKLVGDTEPLSASVGTIRGDFGFDSYELADAENRAVYNLVHCTDGVDAQERNSEYNRESNIWFTPVELGLVAQPD